MTNQTTQKAEAAQLWRIYEQAVRAISFHEAECNRVLRAIQSLRPGG
jgi:hypothetical protein